MEYKEVVKNGFAARSFLPNQVRLSDLKDIILEAERTPSWMNAQERKILFAFFTPVRFMTYLLLLVMTALWIIPDLRLNRIYQESRSVEQGSK